MPKTPTLFEAALRATILTLLPAFPLVIILNLYAIFFGYPSPLFVIVYAIVGVGIWVGVLMRFLPRIKGAKIEKRGEFERITAGFGLLFGIGGALLTAGSFLDRTVTRSSCAIPTTVNVANTNCKVIETV